MKVAVAPYVSEGIGGKPQTFLRQESRLTGRGSNPEPPRYEEMAITRLPQRLERLYCLNYV
jgi:hypothetical protein